MAWSATVHFTSDQTIRIYGKVMASSSGEAIDAAKMILSQFGSEIPDPVEVKAETVSNYVMFVLPFSATVQIGQEHEPIHNGSLSERTGC